MPRTPRFLDAGAAAAELGVTLPTLYAYVSRGLVRSEPGTGKSRARRYHAEDVRRLKARREQRRDPEQAARSALDLGAPVLESAVTLIDGGRFFYRGHDATELARTRTLEEVAALVWTGDADAPPDPAALEAAGSSPDGWDAAHPAESFQRVLARAATEEPNAYDLRPRAVVRSGFRILRLMGAAVAGEAPAGVPLAEVLRRGWGAEEGARGLLDAALVVCVDHELNVSAFTARCAASAGATPYGAVVAGLAALGGARQSGGEVERVEALFDEAERTDVPAMLASRLRRGEGIPGIGHPLYPEGDPRGAALLELLRAADPRSPALLLAERVAGAAGELLGERPVVDFGLVALARALRLPPRSALTLFALGRTVGFVAHALEQYAAGRAIRPRARYTGPPPPA
ncbi:MAG TPA: citrate synthase family protein [Longimicrobiaceae bacterium]|nr:citrate synthase family protein [Longimicrobiaceae bacterium]